MKIYTNVQFARYGCRKKKLDGQKEVHDFEFYKSGKHLDYISRRSAVYLQDDNSNRESLWNEFVDSGLSKQEWLNNRVAEKMNIKKSGVYRLFGDGSDIDIDEEKKVLSELSNEQNIWEMIINPGDLGLENFCVDKFEWNDLLNRNLKKLLKSNKLDPENITGHWVIHTNTEFPHIHISFWEKSPRVLQNDDSLGFKTRGVFNGKTIEKFNEILTNEITFNAEYQNFVNIKNLVREKRKSLKELGNLSGLIFEKDGEFLDSVLHIRNSLINKHNKTYAKASEDVKNSIWKVFNYILENNKEFKNEYSVYKDELEKLKDKDLGSEFNNDAKDKFIEIENKEFESQLGNAIIKLCLADENIDAKNVDMSSFNKKIFGRDIQSQGVENIGTINSPDELKQNLYSKARKEKENHSFGEIERDFVSGRKSSGETFRKFSDFNTSRRDVEKHFGDKYFETNFRDKHFFDDEAIDADVHSQGEENIKDDEREDNMFKSKYQSSYSSNYDRVNMRSGIRYFGFRRRPSLNNSRDDYWNRQLFNWKRIIRKWNWEADGIHFRKKVEALRNYWVNIVLKR